MEHSQFLVVLCGHPVPGAGAGLTLQGGAGGTQTTPGDVTFPSLLSPSPSPSPGGKQHHPKYPHCDFRECCSAEGQHFPPFQEGTGGINSYFFCAWLGGEGSGWDELLSMVLVNTPLGRERGLNFLAGKCLEPSSNHRIGSSP